MSYFNEMRDEKLFSIIAQSSALTSIGLRRQIINIYFVVICVRRDCETLLRVPEMRWKCIWCLSTVLEVAPTPLNTNIIYQSRK